MTNHTIKAWAIVNDETGRIMLNDAYPPDESGEGLSPAIYMTKRAALAHLLEGERIVRIAIKEL